jgi:hypothetical protein
MSEPEYRATFFDRHGPDGAVVLLSVGWGALVFVMLFIGLALRYPPGHAAILSAAAGVFAGSVGLCLSGTVGAVIHRFFVDGTSTPYIEQYSYQEALVMQGRVDDAIASYEAIAAEHPTAIDARIRLAELHARDKHDAARAAAVFRAVQRTEPLSQGQDVYVTNRYVDLLIGPLNDPGRAMVELRRLIERHPAGAAAGHARGVLAELKARRVEPPEAPAAAEASSDPAPSA